MEKETKSGLDEPKKRKKRATPRTRSGCVPCRRSHQKCDERRPTCGLCSVRGRDCTYALQLVWGGRPFSRSTFGQCMSAAGAAGAAKATTTAGDSAVSSSSSSSSVVQIHAEADASADPRRSSPFVYGVVAPERGPDSVLPVDREPDVPSTSSAILPVTSSSLSHPSFLPDLPPAYRSLFDYFMHAVDSFSCDENVKRDFCTTFLPLAATTSHVMASVLNLAAVHRANAGLAQSPKQLALLQMVTVNQLRARLSGLEESSEVGLPVSGPFASSPSSSSLPSSTEAVIATIVMLCYAEIVAGGRKAHSWRLHLEGAAALFTREPAAWTIGATATPHASQLSGRAFLAKCFVSLVALANVSGFPPARSVSRLAVSMADNAGQNRQIDEFTSCSTDLLHVFVEIGSLLEERRRGRQHSGLEEPGPPDSPGPPVSFLASSPTGDDRSLLTPEDRCAELIPTLLHASGRARRHMARDTELPAALPTARREEFVNINESYHEAAILQIHQRIRRLPPSNPAVQDRVQRILGLVSGVELLRGPCPAIVLLFPLFSAGCGAVLPQDRCQVRGQLLRMADMYQIASVRHSIGVLESLWAHRDAHGESEANVSWEDFVDNDTDLILY